MTDCVEWFRRELVKHADRRSVFDAFFDVAGSIAQFLHQEHCLLLLSEDLTNLLDRSEDAVEIARVCDEHCDILVLQLLREYFELRGRRDQDHLRVQSDDALETRMQRVANFSNRLCFLWVIAKSRATNQSIAASDCKNDFGEIGRKRDDTIDPRRQTHTPSSVICDLSRALSCGFLMSAGSKQYYECEPGEFFNFEMR